MHAPPYAKSSRELVSSRSRMQAHSTSLKGLEEAVPSSKPIVDGRRCRGQRFPVVPSDYSNTIPIRSQSAAVTTKPSHRSSVYSRTVSKVANNVAKVCRRQASVVPPTENRWPTRQEAKTIVDPRRSELELRGKIAVSRRPYHSHQKSTRHYRDNRPSKAPPDACDERKFARKYQALLGTESDVAVETHVSGAAIPAVFKTRENRKQTIAPNLDKPWPPLPIMSGVSPAADIKGVGSNQQTLHPRTTAQLPILTAQVSDHRVEPRVSEGSAVRHDATLVAVSGYCVPDCSSAEVKPGRREDTYMPTVPSLDLQGDRNAPHAVLSQYEDLILRIDQAILEAKHSLLSVQMDLMTPPPEGLCRSDPTIYETNDIERLFYTRSYDPSGTPPTQNAAAFPFAIDARPFPQPQQSRPHLDDRTLSSTHFLSMISKNASANTIVEAAPVALARNPDQHSHVSSPAKSSQDIAASNERIPVVLHSEVSERNSLSQPALRSKFAISSASRRPHGIKPCIDRSHEILGTSNDPATGCRVRTETKEGSLDTLRRPPHILDMWEDQASKDLHIMVAPTFYDDHRTFIDIPAQGDVADAYPLGLRSLGQLCPITSSRSSSISKSVDVLDHSQLIHDIEDGKDRARKDSCCSSVTTSSGRSRIRRPASGALTITNVDAASIRSITIKPPSLRQQPHTAKPPKVVRHNSAPEVITRKNRAASAESLSAVLQHSTDGSPLRQTVISIDDNDACFDSDYDSISDIGNVPFILAPACDRSNLQLRNH